MPDYPVKADVDTMLRANDKAGIRSAIGVGQTDAPTFLSVNVGSSTTSLSQLSIVGQAASNTLYLSAPNYIALNSDQISLMNASVRSGLWGRTTGITVLSGHYFGFSSSATDAGFPAATILARDADGILAQRNGTAKQALRVYNTNLSGAPEWAEFDWITSGGTNTLRIGTNLSGTGAARPIDFVTGGVVRMSINTSGNATLTGSLVLGASGVFSYSGRVIFSAPSAGVYLMQNNTQDDFNRIQLGGTTSAFPAIKRNGAGIDIRLADDSAFAAVKGKITTDTAYTATTVVATGYITLYDSTGTAYRVPCAV